MKRFSSNSNSIKLEKFPMSDLPPASAKKRAYVYCRVSTQEQAEHRTSLAQQERDARKFAGENGVEIVGVFVDAGISGSDRSRPEFNRMMLLACGDDHPVDYIIAADMARLARDLEFSVLLTGQLRRAGVKLLLVYQKFEDSHAGLFHQMMTSWQDQDAIVKASANTRRGLRGTAEENFWTGGIIPLGYISQTVELRSKKEKKRLFLCEDEAELVRLIFDLADRGLDGAPMGGRAIADYLNEHGYTLRGRKFFNATIAGILSRPHYVGKFPGNRFDEKGNLLPEDAWTWVSCPQIVSQEQFDRVAALRAKRAPRVTAPRAVNGPTLLIGLAVCGVEGCGCGMTIRTGKSGRYRYYACNARINRGARSCSCPSVRVEKLDELVMREVADQVLASTKLETLLQRVLDVSDDARARKRQEIEQCEGKIEASRKRLSNLHDAIELGTLSARDPDIAERLKRLRGEIGGMNQTLRTLRQQVERGPGRITPEAVQRFGKIVRERLLNGEGSARQQIARAFIKRVIIAPKTIAIEGETAALAHGAAAVARSKELVPSFDREWCRLQDSNL